MSFTTQSQSAAVIDANSANTGTYGLHLGGGTSSGWSSSYSTGAAAFTNSPTHVASASREVCASTDPYLTLTFDKKQTYTLKYQYSWFRLTVNGTPVSDNYLTTYFSGTDGTVCGVWETLTYDLSAYANTDFTLAWESCTKYYDGETSAGCGGDNVYIDNIVLVESTAQALPSTPASIIGFALPNAGAQERYSIGAIAGATSYTWDVPTGWTIDFGQGTTYILATTTSLDGDVTVYATNGAGNSGTRTLGVTTIEAITTFPDISAFANEVQHSTTASNSGFTFVETGWRNYIITDDGDWRADKGGTGSSGTGPGTGSSSGQPDHNPGTSSGYYLYVEASSPNYPSKKFYLWSPPYNLSALSSPICTFWYSMYGGSGMGTLSVQVSADHGKTWSDELNYTLSDPNATSVSGNQGTNWLQGFINLSPYTSETALVIRFTVVTGSALDGDIALDDVQVMDLPVTPVTVDGDIILSDDLFATSGSNITITGSSATTITSNGYGFSIIQVNNSSGITLADDLTTKMLVLLDGIITTGSNILTVDNTLWSSVTAGHSGSFVNGTLRRNIAANTSTYGFPIGLGTTAADYFKADLINNGLDIQGNTDYVQMSVAAQDESGTNTDGYLNTSQNTTDIVDVVADAIWTITPSNSGAFVAGSYGVKLWIANISGLLVDNGFTVVKRPTNSTTYADWSTYESTTTIPEGGQPGRTIASGYAQRLGFTSFSDHGAGNGGGPLPIDLVSFTADLNNGNVDVDWTVASQTNNDYFNVQRSIDGYDWEDIATIEGAGSSSQMMDYTYTDREPYVGVSYYRLKQTDYDGNFETFDPVAVSHDVDLVGLLISPNPVTDAIRITMDGAIYNDLNIIRIYDVKGNMVLQNNLVGNLENYEIQVGELSNPTISTSYETATGSKISKLPS